MNNNLISRQAAIEKIDMLFKELSKDYVDMMGIGYNHAVADAIAILKYLPSTERRGRWIENLPTEAWKYHCSLCGTQEDYKENYCRNCGAKMVNEDEPDY